MLVFRFLRNLPTIPFSFQVYSLITLLFLQFLRQFSGFVCCNEVSCYFCDFLGFCKQFLLNIFLLKLSRQKSVRKNLLQFAILIEFVIFAIVAIFSIHFLTVRLISLKKLRKQFATKFLQQCSILDIRGEPQGSFTQLFQPF